MKDALDNEIIIGGTYGYSLDSNGILDIIIGEAIKKTPTGLCTLKVLYRKRQAYNGEPHQISSVDKTSVKPTKLFPVVVHL